MAGDGLGALVFGTSFGVLTHLRALRAAGIRVHGLVGRDPDRTRDRADFFDIEHAFTDIDEALRLPGIDLVAVATPPASHAPLSVAAAQAGKHLLCEKPFALDLAEARAMYAAVERAGVVHGLGVELRFETHQETLRRTIAAGTIGTPRLAMFLLDMPSLVDPSVELQPWWESAAEGGGWLGAQGSHTIDQIRIMLGEFEAVSANLATLSPRPAMTADDTYTAQFRLAGGCTGILHSSCASGGPFQMSTRIVGSEGTAWLQPGAGSRRLQVWVDTGSGPEQVPDAPDLPHVPPVPPPSEMFPPYAEKTHWHVNGGDLAPFTRVYERIRDRILGRPVPAEPPLGTFADGLAQQSVLDAIRHSAQKGSWVDVESA